MNNYDSLIKRSPKVAINIYVETNGNDSVVHVKQKILSSSGLSESLTIADQMQEGKAKSFKT